MELKTYCYGLCIFAVCCKSVVTAVVQWLLLVNTWLHVLWSWISCDSDIITKVAVVATNAQSYMDEYDVLTTLTLHFAPRFALHSLFIADPRTCLEAFHVIQQMMMICLAGFIKAAQASHQYVCMIFNIIYK